MKLSTCLACIHVDVKTFGFPFCSLVGEYISEIERCSDFEPGEGHQLSSFRDSRSGGK